MDYPSERRLAENEVIIKELNEDVKDFVLKDAPESDFAKKKLRFYCECSNLDCLERIAMTAKEYEAIHSAKNRFVVKPGHSMPEIEDVVDDRIKYMVVEKIIVPPAPKDIDPKRFL